MPAWLVVALTPMWSKPVTPRPHSVQVATPLHDSHLSKSVHRSVCLSPPYETTRTTRAGLLEQGSIESNPRLYAVVTAKLSVGASPSQDPARGCNSGLQTTPYWKRARTASYDSGFSATVILAQRWPTDYHLPHCHYPPPRQFQESRSQHSARVESHYASSSETSGKTNLSGTGSSRATSTGAQTVNPETSST